MIENENVRYPMGVLHSFSIKNIFYDKMDLRLFYFDVAIYQMIILIHVASWVRQHQSAFQQDMKIEVPQLKIQINNRK